jgi:diguanylate cyclase (GGDEF)-like protein
MYEKAKKQQLDVCVAIIDIDFFKKINDTYGHDIGDLVLKHISKLLKNELKSEIISSRFGGEEFCIFFNNTSEIESFKILEEFRKIVANNFILHNDTKIYYTISGGICSKTGAGLEDMIKMADSALYTAKQNGRNQIQIFKGEN